MFLVFRFLRFLCKFVILRTRGGKKEWFFHRFFHIDPHCITMTKIENRDFALIFSGKRPFNTLSKINLSDIVIVTMNFYLYSAQDMLNWNSQCHRLSIDFLKIIPRFLALGAVGGATKGVSCRRKTIFPFRCLIAILLPFDHQFFFTTTINHDVDHDMQGWWI